MYSYKAVSPEDEVLQGTQESQSVESLRDNLRAKGLQVIYIRKVRSSTLGVSNQKLSLESLIEFTLQLEQMAQAGLSVYEALLAQAEEAGKAREIAQQLAKSIQGGKLLSEAFKEHSHIFDRVYVGFVQMGEETGRLAEGLSHIFEHLQWMQSMRDRIRKATRYPLLMFMLLSTVMLVLLMGLVPQLAPFLETLDQEMPWMTQFVLSLSIFIAGYWEGVLLGCILLWLCGWVSYKIFPQVRRGGYYLIGLSPLIGPLFYEITLARYFHYLGHMSSHNLDLLRSLQVSEQVAFPLMKDAKFKVILDSVNAGYGLSEAFSRSGLVPRPVVRMIALGEATGNLPASLVHIKGYFDRRVNLKLDKFIIYMEPALTLIAGLFLVLIVYAVFWPLYETLKLVDL